MQCDLSVDVRLHLACVGKITLVGALLFPFVVHRPVKGNRTPYVSPK